MGFLLLESMKIIIFLCLSLWVLACTRQPDIEITPERQYLTEGRELYHLRSCAKCHGAAGHGGGDLAKELHPPPRDFRDLTHYKAGTTEAQIAETIRTGLGPMSNIPGQKSLFRWKIKQQAAMPAYPYLSLEERLQIAKYVIHIREVYK